MGSHTLHQHPRFSSHSQIRQNGFARSPIVVQWLATLDCSLACAHCLSAESDIDQEMPCDQALGLVDQVAELGVKELLISGGEPFQRQDLPEIIEALASRNVPYSLNTARFPSETLRKTFEKCRPKFVAVSLDGPEHCHNTFRGHDRAFDEAIEAIRYFSNLGIHVAAGTTVTRFNLGHLPKTMEIVAKSGASSWGLHLLVPEGRAAKHGELFLKRRELKSLLRFVADKRNYLPVQLAEEMGFCGDLEPLLRDLPMSCGAGKTQCVILPTGDVVPCTTLDLSTSAGNINERPLADIWRTGFSELRRHRPKGSCRKCEYFSACNSGCWLQRRQNKECFKDVWSPGKKALSAASLAVAIGLASIPACSSQNSTSSAQDVALQDQGAENSGVTFTPINCGSGESQAAPMREDQENSGIRLHRGTHYTLGTPLSAALFFLAVQDIAQVNIDIAQIAEERRQDPAFQFVALLSSEEPLPESLEDRARIVTETLCTQERAPGLSSALFRFLAEPLLDQNPAQRSEQDQNLLRETLFNLATMTDQWRAEIYEHRLDPYLASGRRHQSWNSGWILKSGPPPRPPWVPFNRAVTEERWGAPLSDEPAPTDSSTPPPLVEGWLDDHPHDEWLRLTVSSAQPGATLINRSGSSQLDSRTTFGIFDVLATPSRGQSTITVRWGEEMQPLTVSLPRDAELTYIDLLVLTYAQHRDTIDSMAQSALRLTRQTPSMNAEIPTNPLLLPAIHPGPDATSQPSPAQTWITTFWLF